MPWCPLCSPHKYQRKNKSRSKANFNNGGKFQNSEADCNNEQVFIVRTYAFYTHLTYGYKKPMNSGEFISNWKQQSFDTDIIITFSDSVKN